MTIFCKCGSPLPSTPTDGMIKADCCPEGRIHIVWKKKSFGVKAGWYNLNGFKIEDNIDLYVVLCQWCGKKLPENPNG